MHMDKVIVGDLSFEPYIREIEIKERVQDIGQEINKRYLNDKPVFIGILNGCFMFFSDLMKEINIPCETSFVKLASYSGTQNGSINQLLGIGIDIKNRHVIVVEDIIDTGNSLKHIIAVLQQLEVSSIAVCSLLLKPTCLQHNFDQDLHIGFEIDKEFVVGYGLDYNGYGRNLRHIYRLES